MKQVGPPAAELSSAAKVAVGHAAAVAWVRDSGGVSPSRSGARPSRGSVLRRGFAQGSAA